MYCSASTGWENRSKITLADARSSLSSSTTARPNETASFFGFTTIG